MRTRLLSGWLAAAALAIGAPVPAQAQVTSVNGQIAYVVCGPSTVQFPSEQCDIWVMNPDGGGQTNLTNTSDKNEVSPAWSADGTRIAYFEGFNGLFNLWVMDANGANASMITTTSAYPYGSTPTWSPGGTQIAFVRNMPGSPVSIQADIVVIDLATGLETVISRPALFGGVPADADEIEPAWSPDGGRIAFAGVRSEKYLDGITGAPVDGAQWEIVTVNPDGSDEQVVSAGAPRTDRAQYLEEDRSPAWSPDGTKIVFMSQAQIPACCGPWQIWAVNRDGTGATNLTNDPAVNDLYPSWSPDGTQIIFSRSSSLGFDLYTMPAPSGLPLSAALAAMPLAAEAPSAAAAAVVTPLLNDASDPDWGRKPGTLPPAQRFTLYVSLELQGKGAGGSVSSSPAGIKCLRDCSEPYATGAQVTLTASPKNGTRFSGWSGACSGTQPSCQITVNDVKVVKATFARAR